MRRWVLVPSSLAPVLLIGGFAVAATRQVGFDSTRDTISALAALDARDRWIMTLALYLLGLCHVATAVGLRPAAVPGRIALGLGGVATVLVAVFPLPGGRHAPVATAAFGLLAVWPALAWRRGGGPWLLRPLGGLLAAGVLLALVAWFGWALAAGVRVGLAERVAAGAQALWPLAVVLAARRTCGSQSTECGRAYVD